MSTGQTMSITESRDELLQLGEEGCDEAARLAEQGDYTAALECLCNAEECFLKINDQHWLNFLRHEKYRILLLLDRQEEALELTHQIIEGYRQTRSFRGLALIFIHKAELLRETGKAKEAVEYINLSEAVIKSEKLDDLFGYLNAASAMIRLQVEDYVSAIRHFGFALDFFSSHSQFAEIAWSLNHLGICYKKLGDFESAEKNLMGAYQMYYKSGDFESGNVIIDQLKEMYLESGQERKLGSLEKMIRQTRKGRIT